MKSLAKALVAQIINMYYKGSCCASIICLWLLKLIIMFSFFLLAHCNNIWLDLKILHLGFCGFVFSSQVQAICLPAVALAEVLKTRDDGRMLKERGLGMGLAPSLVMEVRRCYLVIFLKYSCSLASNIGLCANLCNLVPFVSEIRETYN